MMIEDGERILIDTNIALRLLDRSSPEHVKCSQAIQALRLRGAVPCVCAQVLIESWAVLTRPLTDNGFGWSPERAEAYCNDLLRVMPCLSEPAVIFLQWIELAARYRVIGKQAHDARIAAIMTIYGIRFLLSLNPAHFARYAEIECVTPDALRQADSQ